MSDVGVIVTGLVGAAGIGGTLLSARLTARWQRASLKLSISAENERSTEAEKRRIYASYLASVIEAFAAASTLDLVPKDNEEERKVRTDETHTAVARMINAVSEMTLIAPVDLSQLAEDTAREVSDYCDDVEAGRDADLKFGEIRHKLHRAMRVDLGEPVGWIP